ncbi:MAG: putative sulfate exporter family transporter [Bilophila wadsworthia]
MVPRHRSSRASGINSLGIIPKQAVSVINSLDIFMLTMAMCALGMETSLEKVRMVGPKPFLLAGVLALWLIGGGYFVTRFILSLNF